MSPNVEELKSELSVIHSLESALQVLAWDQSTYMPTAGGDARAKQMAVLGRLAHERQVGSRMRDLMQQHRGLADDDTVDGALYRRARWSFLRAMQVPSELVAELREHTSQMYIVWAEAKPKSDFAAVLPYLEKNIELSRRYAECLRPEDHIADPLIDAQDKGMTAASVRSLFTELRTELVPLASTICDQTAPDPSFLHQSFDPDKQLTFGAKVVASLGYDFERGRQDLTHHPFMVRLSGSDVRITTRVHERRMESALFGTIHEAGHALYELGIDPTLDGTPLGHGVSTGVHESQSRLWENIVGRSKPFWEHWFPKLAEVFPEQFRDVDVRRFHEAINRVERSPIRVRADEVTYNLHVMLRFELEMQMLEGSLKAKELPDAWNERMAKDLRFRPTSLAEGCMQDVHWFCENIGGHFQGYAIGNIMSAQFYEAASRALNDPSDKIARGDVSELREWLGEHIYRHGARYDPLELVQRATGEPLSTKPFINYLKRKFGKLYALSF